MHISTGPVTPDRKKPILVIGGGIAGMTAALEVAEVGYSVILVEKEACLGGRVVHAHRYFPKMCPPGCGFEINLRRMRRNPNVIVYTNAEVISLEGEVGSFWIRIRRGADVSTASLPYSLPIAETLCAMGDDAPSRKMRGESLVVEVGAVIVATGWQPYDAERLTRLGGNRCKNAITNVMMERLAAKDGPTGGVIRRPSDDKIPNRVAFVQCAGSRDDDNLPYCSAVCCMATLKQARYLIEQNNEVRVTIYYIDIRTIGRHEKFYYDLLESKQISFVKGKVADIAETPDGDRLQLAVEDTVAGTKLHPVFDMVVLAFGTERRVLRANISPLPRRLWIPRRHGPTRRGVFGRLRKATL